MGDLDLRQQDRAVRVQHIRQRWLDRAAQIRGTEAHALCRVAFTSIVSGKPFLLADARAQLNMPSRRFDTLVGQLVGQGRLTLDGAHPAITGARGLSLVPSRHMLILNGRPLHTWCAFDAVGIPAGLGADARVESRCADTGEPVWAEIVGGRLTLASHQPLFVTLVPPDETRSVCDGICADIGFLCGQPWAVDDRAVLMSVEEAIDLGRTLWADATVPI